LLVTILNGFAEWSKSCNKIVVANVACLMTPIVFASAVEIAAEIVVLCLPSWIEFGLHCGGPYDEVRRYSNTCGWNCWLQLRLELRLTLAPELAVGIAGEIVFKIAVVSAVGTAVGISVAVGVVGGFAF
jgi:hypothetical protein